MANKTICLLVAAPQNLQSFAEACSRFSPQIALRSLGSSFEPKHEAVFVDLTKSMNLFSEESLLLRLKALAKRFHISDFKVAVVNGGAGLALAQARYGDLDAIEKISDYAEPFFRSEEIQNKVRKTFFILSSLGVKTLSDFISLPPQTLASHLGDLGEDALFWHRAIQNKTEVAWPVFHPLPIISEKTSTECGDLESMLFVLRGMIERSMSRLRGRCERASTVQVTLQLEPWSTVSQYERKWMIPLPLPQTSAQGLLSILKEHLGFQLGKSPIEAPVQSIEFEILESVPGRGAQRDFFNRHEEENEAWNSLIGRIGERLGVKHVFVAVPVERYVPEKAYERDLSQSTTHFFEYDYPERPTRLLENPEPISISATQRGEGLEKIKTESWGKKVERDYFKVFTESGEKLWFFLNGKKTHLHGYFD